MNFKGGMELFSTNQLARNSGSSRNKSFVVVLMSILGPRLQKKPGVLESYLAKRERLVLNPKQTRHGG